MSRRYARQVLLRLVFLAYCAALLWLLFGRSRGWPEGLSYRQALLENVNLTPLLTIRNYLYVIIHRTNDAVLLHCIVNLAGNVVLFVPIGCLLPQLFASMRRFPRFFITCLGLIFLVEAVQLFSLLGSFDVDDILLNLAGMTTGFILQRCRR